MKFLWFFEEISSQTSPETLSVTSECCLGISNEKYFHQFSKSYFEQYFLYDFIKKPNDFHRFCLHCHAVFVHNHQVWFKKHENFNEIEQKIWFKIGVGKLMKIFFLRNVPNNIPWSLKAFPVMSATIFPRKTIKFSCFFMFVD